MNLHGIVGAAIAAVNPFIPAQIQQQTGGTVTADDGTRTPAYADPVDVMLQRQDLSSKDLRQLDNMNVQGVLCSAYVQGNWYGVNRNQQQGGDLFIINGQTWLVVQVFEAWPDWCKVGLCLQL